jgi:hypothetical protein
LADTELSPQDWFNKINAMFTTITRRPWEDRLARPADRASGSFFTRYTTPRNRFLDMLWSYNVGDPPLPQIEPEYREAFLHVLRKARSNYAPMCIAAMADRMELQSVSTLQDDDTDGDDIAADIMEETGFGAVWKTVQDYAFSMSESYGMVVPGVEGGPTLSNGAPIPSIHAIDPRRCIGIPDFQNPVRLRAAVVKQYDPITDQQVAFLFLPGKKYTFDFSSGTTWTLRAGESDVEDIEGLDALGGIPIVRFDNRNGMGEYEPHIDLLDRINDVTLQRIIGFWYQALRQRALIGDEDEDDEDEEYEGDEVVETGDGEARGFDPDRDLRAGPGALWRFPADWKLWESQQTDFAPFINGKRDDVKEFAAVTSTPLHLITPDAANGSAEGAGLMRESLTSKVRDRRTRFTPSLKLLWRITFAVAGADDRGRGMRLHWGPIEFRTLAEKASAGSQAVGTLSLEDRCERIYEMSPDETERNIQRMTADGLMGFATAPGNSQPPQARALPAAPPASGDVPSAVIAPGSDVSTA